VPSPMMMEIKYIFFYIYMHVLYYTLQIIMVVSQLMVIIICRLIDLVPFNSLWKCQGNENIFYDKIHCSPPCFGFEVEKLEDFHR